MLAKRATACSRLVLRRGWKWFVYIPKREIGKFFVFIREHYQQHPSIRIFGFPAYKHHKNFINRILFTFYYRDPLRDVFHSFFSLVKSLRFIEK